jgi:hypothetical protein
MVPLTRPSDTLSPCRAYLSLKWHGARGEGDSAVSWVVVAVGGIYTRNVRPSPHAVHL